MNMSVYFPSTLVAGGQTGASRAALAFALGHEIAYTGYCPAGRPAEDNPTPSVYALTETKSNQYPESIWLNVKSSEATAIFDPLSLPRRQVETVLAVSACKRAGRPFVLLQGFPQTDSDLRELTTFLRAFSPRVLHIIGTAESQTPGMEAHVTAVLTRLLANAVPRPAPESVGLLSYPTFPRLEDFPAGNIAS